MDVYIAERAEKEVTKFLTGLEVSAPDWGPSKERAALVSLAYNTAELLGKGLKAALQMPNEYESRAEAWYQIRYVHGDQLWSRRYREATMFGLTGTAAMTEDEARAIYRMYSKYGDVMYSRDLANSGVASLTASLGPAATFLIDKYGHGQIFSPLNVWVGKSTGGLISKNGTVNPNLMIGDAGSDTLTGGTGNDVLIGGAGIDTLRGGKGDDYLEGGANDDTYILDAGDGTDTIEDKEGNNKVILNDKPIALLVRKADGSLGSPDGAFTATVSGTDLIVTDIATGTKAVLNTDFQEGDFGIRFIDAPTESQTTLTINGDITPTDTNPSTPGIQADGDAQGNPIGTPQPYEDILGGSAGNDHILAGELNDDVGAGAGDDWIEGGNGNDYLWGYTGDDLIEGGAGSDILIGDEGNDRLYGNAQVDIAPAIANGNTDTGSGLKGDWLSGNAGDDTLVAGADNDVLAGGAGADLLIAGAGDDNILGDSDYVPQYIWEAAPRYSIGGVLWYHSSADTFNWTITPGPDTTVFAPVVGETNPVGGGADVIYAGAGNDHVWAGEGDDTLFGGDGGEPRAMTAEQFSFWTGAWHRESGAGARARAR